MSVLDLLEPIYKLLPEIKMPEMKPDLKKRIMWSVIVLLLFFVMGNINVIGIDIAKSAGGQLGQLQTILASKIGTLITAGIGPIVLSSIILQLLVGAGFISIDLTEPRDKARFTAMQKLFAIVLCFFEAGVYAMTPLLFVEEGMMLPVILQIAFGSIMLMYLDEIVSKYGIGSGIGLFIAGGVSANVFWRIFNPLNLMGQFDPLNGSGYLFLFLQEMGSNLLGALNLYMLPIFFTLVVFFVVVFAEGMHVNIPITMGRRGTGGRFPVKFLYVSNIPVILAVALFANLQLWAELAKNIPIAGMVIGGISAIVQAPYGFRERLFLQISSLNPLMIGGEIIQTITSLTFIGLGGEIIHAILYIAILTLVCIVFGKFWVEMGGQGAEAVSKQLSKSGMSIPGFRRDPRIIRQVLERYIPPISILGSAFVGLLAGFADLTGALGSGTGILLTVGIVYRLYEELARQQLMDMHPMLGGLFGG